MNRPLRIAVAGLGTVGAGTVRILAEHGAMLAARAGRPLRPVAVSARDKTRDRDIDLSGIPWVDDALALVETDADVIVELIGGEDGIALALVERALDAGKAVVTANKALIAHHGSALADRAHRAGTALLFEAAVAGGIPILKAIREGLAANRIDRVFGILNGTCNYILTTMRETGRPFDEVLADAQALGYAEADPSFDIDGVDSAHKLAILAALGFGRTIDFAGIHVEGIRHISPVDIAFAEELGYRIKLLGIAEQDSEGLSQRVHPAMVALSSPLAHVEGVFNAVVADGDHVGSTVYQGRGAGAGPTASAVVADLIDLARGATAPLFGVPVPQLQPAQSRPLADRFGAYYVRLMVVDRPGVIADVAASLRDHRVSLEAMLQRARRPDDAVPVVLTTHDVHERDMVAALGEIGSLDAVLESPRMVRIETL